MTKVFHEFWLCSDDQEPMVPMLIDSNGKGRIHFKDRSGFVARGILHKNPRIYADFVSPIPPTAIQIDVIMPFLHNGVIALVTAPLPTFK